MIAATLRDLEAEITELVGHLNAANYRLLVLIAEFDRRHGWNDGSTPSCAHWLNWKCGIDLGAAREKVRAAHALEGLPRIANAMCRGQLSYSKVRALTRVACPNTEEYFLDIALHGTASHVERLVREYRRAKEAEELSREARQQATRGVRYFYDEDGSLVVKGRLPAEVGALFVKALDAAMKDTWPDVSAETSGQRPSFAARRADALAQITESFLAHGAEALSGGDRQQIVVHVDAGTLQERSEGEAGGCRIEGGPSIPAATARRLACDSSIVAIVEDARGEPLDVGRKTRTIPPALRRALDARDRGCRFPGCSNTRYVDAHHIRHWADGGETKVSNLVTLCRFHHRQVHEGRVAIQSLDDGGLRFVRPGGHAFESPGAAATGGDAEWQQLVALHREQGLEIDRNTAATLWRGERMDHGLAIEVLLQRARRGQRPVSECSNVEKQ
ncbi:MAG: DUF222 domain-containing protein [Steroidobacteraceae bacterium]